MCCWVLGHLVGDVRVLVYGLDDAALHQGRVPGGDLLHFVEELLQQQPRRHVHVAGQLEHLLAGGEGADLHHVAVVQLALEPPVPGVERGPGGGQQPSPQLLVLSLLRQRTLTWDPARKQQDALCL